MARRFSQAAQADTRNGFKGISAQNVSSLVQLLCMLVCMDHNNATTIAGVYPLVTSSEKMVRKQFLVSPSTARKLDQLAAKRGTSASEIVRQAINSFDMMDAETMESPELMELVSVRLKEAIVSTRRAQRTVSRSLKVLSSAER